jgi:hypothetical protein
MRCKYITKDGTIGSNAIMLPMETHRSLTRGERVVALTMNWCVQHHKNRTENNVDTN